MNIYYGSICMYIVYVHMYRVRSIYTCIYFRVRVRERELYVCLSVSPSQSTYLSIYNIEKYISCLTNFGLVKSRFLYVHSRGKQSNQSSYNMGGEINLNRCTWQRYLKSFHHCTWDYKQPELENPRYALW